MGALFDPHCQLAWARACIAVAVTEAVSQGLKRATRRPRPSLRGLPPLVATPSRYSFPSAHTATVVAASRSFPRRCVARCIGAVAVATGLSRLYAGVHYPSDVAAGAALGWAIGTAFRRGAPA